MTPAHGHEVTLALGFGRTQAQSVSVAEGSLSHPFALTAAKYVLGWAAYDAGLRPPPPVPRADRARRPAWIATTTCRPTC